MAEKLYIKLPGGVILHHNDGTSDIYRYGQEVDVENLADYQLETLDAVADNTPRSIENAELELAREAANAEPVVEAALPDNYDELDEEEAVALVINSPVEAQTAILKHELINKGRNKVVDAADSAAVEAARGGVEALADAGAAAKPKRARKATKASATPAPASES